MFWFEKTAIPHSRRNGWGLRWALAMGLAVWPVAVTGCAGSTGGVSHARASQIKQAASNERVILYLVLGAGDGGWCVTPISAAGSTCPTFRLPQRLGPFQGPVIVENWSGRSSTSKGPINEAIVLTTGEAASVSLEGRAPIATHADPWLPDHLRAAIIELHGGSKRHVFGLTAPPPFPISHFIALNKKNEPISQTRGPGSPLEFHVPSLDRTHSKNELVGVCRLEATGIIGAVFDSGGVMAVIRPHADIRGREFVDCVHASYLVQGWPLEADVLLDAANPGSTPAPLPAMRPLTGHVGIFQGPGIDRIEVARRIAGAWLLVAKGQDLRQRLTLLEHMHARFLG